MAEIDILELLKNNALSFLISTIILGSAFDMIRRFWAYLFSLKYRGWSACIEPKDSLREPYETDLLWEEVKRFENSAFEKRKFIQSVVTSEGEWLKAGQVETTDPKSWVYVDKENTKYIFNFKLFPHEKKKIK